MLYSAHAAALPGDWRRGATSPLQRHGAHISRVPRFLQQAAWRRGGAACARHVVPAPVAKGATRQTFAAISSATFAAWGSACRLTVGGTCALVLSASLLFGATLLKAHTSMHKRPTHLRLSFAFLPRNRALYLTVQRHRDRLRRLSAALLSPPAPTVARPPSPTDAAAPLGLQVPTPTLRMPRALQS